MITHIEPSTVRELDLFTGMRDAEIKEVLDVCQIEAVPAGQMIYDPANRRQALYMLLEGELEVDLPLPGLGERMLLTIQPHGVFGEVGFFHPGPHSAMVKCVENAQLLRLDRPAFIQLTEDDAMAALKLTINAAGLLAARLAATDQWMINVVTNAEKTQVAESWRKFRAGLLAAGQPSSAGMVGLPGGW